MPVEREKAILIGGCARVGKTTLMQHVIREFGLCSLSLDALEDVLKDRGVAPDIRAGMEYGILESNPDMWLHALRMRDEQLVRWSYPYIHNMLNMKGLSLVAEGGLFPDFVDGTFEPISGQILDVYLVDTSIEQQHQRLIVSRDTDPYSWHAQRGYTDDDLLVYAKNNANRGRFIREMSIERGKTCLDISEVGIVEAQDMLMDAFSDFLAL